MDEIIGIISDTHDYLPLIDKSVEQFNESRVSMVLHAGDYISPFTISHFKPLKSKLIGVYGNNCAERSLLKRKFIDIGAEMRGDFAEIRTGNLKIALLHGHEDELLKSIINSRAYDIVVYGHTHLVRVQKNNSTLVINPGEACGYLTGKATIAILNPKTLNVDIINLCSER